MVSLLYDDVFKTMNIFIGDGNDVESVQNLYGVLQIIQKGMRAIVKGGPISKPTKTMVNESMMNGNCNLVPPTTTTTIIQNGGNNEEMKIDTSSNQMKKEPSWMNEYNMAVQM